MYMSVNPKKGRIMRNDDQRTSTVSLPTVNMDDDETQQTAAWLREKISALAIHMAEDAEQGPVVGHPYLGFVKRADPCIPFSFSAYVLS